VDVSPVCSTTYTLGAATPTGPKGAADTVTRATGLSPTGLSIFAFPVSFAGGVYVAAGDVNGDGHADVIARAGPGAAPTSASYPAPPAPSS
jgi:hypothetical protein